MDIKNVFPIEVAKYAVTRKVSEDTTFALWVMDTLMSTPANHKKGKLMILETNP